MAERREGDVFFSGVLLYKPGTWVSECVNMSHTRTADSGII